MLKMQPKQKPKKLKKNSYTGDDVQWMYDLFAMPTEKDVTRDFCRMFRL